MEKTELRTNYKNQVKRYELAERTVWSTLPNWKKQVIIDCRNHEWEKVKSDRILREYTAEVITLAESQTVLNDKLPAVPKTRPNLSVQESTETAINPS